MKLGFMLNIILIIAAYIYVPDITGFSKDNPKIKTARSILIMFIIFSMGKEILIYLNADKLFSNEVNDKIYIGINSIMIMYFGNLSPKLINYKNIGTRNAWMIGDEKIWRKATKIFAYLSFVMSISMFILSFFLDSYKVVIFCELIWLGIPAIYILLYYNKKFKIN